MNVISKISIVLGKFRSFSFLSVLLDKKMKSLKNDLKMNQESIAHYNKRIKFHKTMIEIHENDITKLGKKNIGIGINISRIKSAKKI